MKAEIIKNPASRFLLALRVPHDKLDELTTEIDQLSTDLENVRGFSSLDAISRDGGLGIDSYIIIRFHNVELLDEWRRSTNWLHLLSDLEQLAIADVSWQQAAGSNIWFQPVVSMPSTPKAPPIWKRWLTSMLAVYPALIALIEVLRPVTSTLPEPLGLFIVAFVLTGLTTAFIVPWLSRILHGWLNAK